MADVIHTHDVDDRAGSGAALGVILGVLLVLALLVGGYFLFFRGGAVTPNTTIIQEEQVQPAPDVNVQPPAGDTDIDINGGTGGGGGTTDPNTGGGTGGTEPAPTTP